MSGRGETETTGVVVEARGPVLRLTLDDPPTRNALSRAGVAALARALREADEADGIRVVVLGHTGGVFCSGANLKELRAAEPGAPPATDAQEAFTRLLALMVSLRKPIVGRIAGHARAGGVGLVAACDVAVVADDAELAFSEVRLGLVPAMIAPLVVARLGLGASLDLLLTGETFTGAEAARLGLAARAVPREAVDATVDAVVEALRRGGPTALATTKRFVHRLGGPDPRLLAELGSLSALQTLSAEGAEGVVSFLERRPPRWAD